jgi:hypothetical protein
MPQAEPHRAAEFGMPQVEYIYMHASSAWWLSSSRASAAVIEAEAWPAYLHSHLIPFPSLVF